MRSLVLSLILLLPLAAGAVEQFQRPEQQQRYWELSGQLRCLVCQGESIIDSNADLAKDLRGQVARMVREGKSDQEVIDYMTARYGDFILFRPPLKVSTILLWFGPFLLLVVGAVVLIRALRRRAAPGELTEQQRQRARELLEGKREL